MIRGLAARLRLTPAIDLDDLVQVGLLAALRAARDWRPDGGRGIESYCRMMAIYAMVDLGRAELRHLQRRDTDADVQAASGGRMAGAGWGMLDRHIETLPERKRELLRLLYIEGFSQADVGRAWGVSRERIRQLHAEALDALRNSLDLSLSGEERGAETLERAGTPRAAAPAPRATRG